MWEVGRLVRAYWALLLAGARRQAGYRLAMAAGLTAGVFFGIVRTAVFLALYRDRGEVGGLDLPAVLTYVWVLESLFGVVWAGWIWELPESIRAGDFAVELLRPGDLYLRQLAFELGRSLVLLLVRTPLPVAVATLLLPLRLPGDPAGLVLFAASLALAAVIAFQVRFLLGAAAFWTPDYRTVFNLAFPILYLAAGFVIPVDYFPSALRALATFSPLHALVMAPVRVATGRDPLAALAGQVAWVAGLWLFGRLVMALASRRLVVHGG
jgi:ABC-2 type transport system permease protein